jgi:hypothetical protein
MIRKGWLLLIVVLAMTAAGCLPTSTTTTTTTTTITTTTTTPPPYSVYELGYRLLADFSDYFWCDPYQWPLARPEQEARDALEQFPAIRANRAEITTILAHLELPEKADYTDAEKLAIFREHNRLGGAVQITAAGSIYEFTLRVGEGEGRRLEGTITPAGAVAVQNEAPSINTCPICLAAGTLIDTPDGPVPVERLNPGMEVWTVDAAGRPVAAALLAISATPVPPSFRVVRLALDDGRSVTASPGHPTTEGKALGSYRPGDNLDGARVASVEILPYTGGSTFDLLPGGPTGYYRAGGILVKSTIVLK